MNRPDICTVWPEFTSYSDRNEYTQIRYLTIGKMEIIQRKLPKLALTSQKILCLHYKDKPIRAVKGNNPVFFFKITSNIKIHRREN